MQSWVGSRIVPLVVIEDPKHVAPLIDALLEAGLGLIEIALRTPRALEAIETAAKLGSMTVAAGTVVKVEQFASVRSAGAHFAVSPSFTPALAQASRLQGLPWIPGIASTSEAQSASEQGFDHLKIYPADLLGGPGFVSALGAVLPDLRFIPSGGVTQQNFSGYLSKPNVFAVSGSWIAPKELIASAQFTEITARARSAVALIQ